MRNNITASMHNQHKPYRVNSNRFLKDCSQLAELHRSASRAPVDSFAAIPCARICAAPVENWQPALSWVRQFTCQPVDWTMLRSPGGNHRIFHRLLAKSLPYLSRYCRHLSCRNDIGGRCLLSIRLGNDVGGRFLLSIRQRDLRFSKCVWTDGWAPKLLVLLCLLPFSSASSRAFFLS